MNLGLYQNNTIQSSITYNLNRPTVNASYASRICTENYQYTSGRNMSALDDMYKQKRGYNAIVTDFIDVDFSYTNNSYYSKKLSITSIVPITESYFISYLITNDLYFKDIKSSIIMEKGTVPYLYFYFILNGAQVFFIKADFLARSIEFYSSIYGTFKTLINFLPISTRYSNILLSIERNTALNGNTFNIKSYCYNQSGKYYYNSSFCNLDVLQYNKVIVFEYYFLTFSAGITWSIISYDLNFIQYPLIRYQNAVLNRDFSLDDIRLFYLLKVPIYLTQFRKTTSESIWVFANTICLGRQLRYKTNASDSYVYQSQFLNDNTLNQLNESFYMNLEIGFNHTGTIYAPIDIVWTDLSVDNLFIQISGSEKGIHINDAEILLPDGINSSSAIFNIQYKNHLLVLTIILDGKRLSIQRIIYNKQILTMDLNGPQVCNAEIKSMVNSELILFSNSSSILPLSSIDIDFHNRVNNISYFIEFSNLIHFPRFTDSTFTFNSRTYELITARIVSMNCNFSRDSENGIFNIYETTDYIRSIFKLTQNLNDSFIDYDFLYEKNEGYLTIQASFFNPSVDQLILRYKFVVTKLMIYTDDTVLNNLIVSKALQLLVPISIFISIIIGFKSNSNSKYLPILGIYFAIFTFYLLEYISLLFLVLAFIIQSIGLYLIMKNEKNDGGI